MGDRKNLSNKEAIEKIKALAKAADICMFATNLMQLPLAARPMSTQEVDEEGCLWFFCKDKTELKRDIDNDDRVQLFYSNKSASEYLSIYGTATVIKDEAKAKELWSAMVKAWFPDGADDPELRIIKVEPAEAYYWDTKHNRMVSLLKILASTITGNEMDDSIQGNIKLK